jgi:hypothetical protein
MLHQPLPGVMSLGRRLEARRLPLRLALRRTRHGMLLGGVVLGHDGRDTDAQHQDEPHHPGWV